MTTLYAIATPIGNMEDITLRAIRILGEVGALACEDTRKTRNILERNDIPKPKTIFSCHEHNETRVVKRIIGLLESGCDVGLCTNAGYPGISDPGYRVISECVAKGFDVEVIPGASAVPTALVASGLPSSSYTFKGFPPRKTGARKRFIEVDANLPHTLVFFESPHRVGKFLADAREVLGDRRAAVCTELTKKFERVRRGFLSDLAEDFRDTKVKGEVTVVIAGNNPKFARAEVSED
ncbi:16S rRNA (cytidine(1402)-2'-O)-methyltransferase [Candidatus Hydrogenedentota bacterium]